MQMKVNAFDQTMSRFVTDGGARSYALMRYANLQERRRHPCPTNLEWRELMPWEGKSSWEQCSSYPTSHPHDQCISENRLHLCWTFCSTSLPWLNDFQTNLPMCGFELVIPSWQSQAPTLTAPSKAHPDISPAAFSSFETFSTSHQRHGCWCVKHFENCQWCWCEDAH